MQFLGSLLYFGTGDGGGGGDPPTNAQNLDFLLGKLMRIDPRPGRRQPYSVPPHRTLRGPARTDRSTPWASATLSASPSTG